MSRARSEDWNVIWDAAKRGDLTAIPPDIRIRHYSTLKRIRVDHLTPEFRDDIRVDVYWGDSGTGKSRRAWHEALQESTDVYIKNPNTKWWDGYRGQTHVIIDEFTGRVDISYIQTWLDRYPALVEVKGSTVPLQAIRFWITSNVNPDIWYPDLNPAQAAALRRRLSSVTHFDTLWNPPALVQPDPVTPVVNELDLLFNF